MSTGSDLGLRAFVQSPRDARAASVRGQGETHLRYPLKGLGYFLECLLVTEFRTQGFIGPARAESLTVDERQRLSELHLKAREQLGEAFYRSFPSLYFSGRGISQQVTWESSRGVFDPARVFMSTQDLLSFARALTSSQCHELRPEAVEHASSQGWQLFANEDGSFLAWSAEKIVVGTSLGRHQHMSALRRLEQIVGEDKSQP